MVVTGTNGGAFCKDFGAVLISDVTGSIRVDYTVTAPLKTDILSETYTADASGIIRINDLGELAQCYFEELPVALDSDSENVTSVNHIVRIDAKLYDDSDKLLTSFSQKFFYSNCRSTIDNAYSYLGFLSRHRKRKVRLDQSLCVGYFARGQKTGVGVYYKQGGVAKWTEFQLADARDDDSLTIRNVSSDTVLANLKKHAQADDVTIDDLFYYIVYLKHDGNVVDAIQFDIDTRYFSAISHFVFYNCFGVPDTLYFTGKDERSSELVGTYAMIQREYRKVSTEYNIYHGINTGFINETLRDCVEDLVNSGKVYLYDSSGLGEQVTITEVDFQESKPRTEPVNVRLKFRLASDCQRRFNRDDTIDLKIFDHTFGDTFE